MPPDYVPYRAVKGPARYLPLTPEEPICRKSSRAGWCGDHAREAIWSIAGLTALLLSCTAVTRADDWPEWGGRDSRNMVARAFHLPVAFQPGEKRPDGSGIDPTTTENVRWTARLGSEVYASATVAGGRVFIGTNDQCLRDPRYHATGGGLLMCLDEATGHTLWQLVVRDIERTAKTKKLHNHLQVGICSPATVDGRRVYVVTNRAEVLCLDVNGMTNGNDGPFIDEGHYTRGEDQPPVPLGPGDPDIVWRFDLLRELSVFPTTPTVPLC